MRQGLRTIVQGFAGVCCSHSKEGGLNVPPVLFAMTLSDILLPQFYSRKGDVDGGQKIEIEHEIDKDQVRQGVKGRYIRNNEREFQEI